MTNEQKLREIAYEHAEPKVTRNSYGEPDISPDANKINAMLSDLTALISEWYYPKEFTRWFRSEKFYDIFEESTDGEDNTQWEYLPSGQILNTTDELFNYWKTSEQ